MDILEYPIVDDKVLRLQPMLSKKFITHIERDIYLFIFYNILPFIYHDDNIYIGMDIYNNNIDVSDEYICIYFKHLNNKYVVKIKRNKFLFENSEFRKIKKVNNNDKIKVDNIIFLIDYEMIMRNINDIGRNMYSSFDIADYIKKIINITELTLLKTTDEININSIDRHKKLFLNVLPDTDLTLTFTYRITTAYINENIIYNNSLLKDDMKIYSCYDEFYFVINFIMPYLKLNGNVLGNVKEIYYGGCGRYGYGIIVKYETVKLFMKITFINSFCVKLHNYLGGVYLIDLGMLNRIYNKYPNCNFISNFYGYMTGNKDILPNMYLFMNGIELLDELALDNLSLLCKDKITKEDLKKHISYSISDRLYLFFECADRDLRYYKNNITFDMIGELLGDLTYGISRIHKCHICHRDIKLDNILCFTSGRKYRINDFGCAVNINTDKLEGLYIDLNFRNLMFIESLNVTRQLTEGLCESNVFLNKFHDYLCITILILMNIQIEHPTRAFNAFIDELKIMTDLRVNYNYKLHAIADEKDWIINTILNIYLYLYIFSVKSSITAYNMYIKFLNEVIDEYELKVNEVFIFDKLSAIVESLYDKLKI